MNDTKIITYHFDVEGHAPYQCDVEVQQNTGITPDHTNAPEWTRNDFHECTSCAPHGFEYCPIALRLVEPVQHLGKLYSYERTNVTVTTPERVISQETDIQTAVTSLFGLLMATSSCPSMQPMRPMAWHHLPFSTFEETLFRMTSTHLLGHYFAGDLITSQDTLLPEIEEIYKTLSALNQDIVGRLRTAAVSQKDAPFNAINHLDNFALLISMNIKSELDEMQALFNA